MLESDYLLGVYDEIRMGGLRFALEKGGPFLRPKSDSPAMDAATCSGNSLDRL